MWQLYNILISPKYKLFVHDLKVNLRNKINKGDWQLAFAHNDPTPRMPSNLSMLEK